LYFSLSLYFWLLNAEISSMTQNAFRNAPTLKNPFPGLRPFGIEESHLFFGREHQVEELLKKLSRFHFVSVVGTSGSGKSSLVRAGLLAKLYNGYNTETGSQWTIAVMRPGANPLLNLASCLFASDVFGDGKTDEENTKQVLEMISNNVLGLIQTVRTRIGRGTNFLLLVDQFEELFRFAGFESDEKAKKQADHFVQLLIEAVRQHDAGIYVVITLRADFLGDCSAFEGLPEAINDGQYLIPRLNREHYKAAIAGPINYAQGKIAPRLMQQLLNDMSNNQDQLPILQHALMRTWENWETIADTGVPMDLDIYQKVGGMDRALNLHANEAFSELNEKQKKLAELIFKCITMKGVDNRGIRRPTKLKDICAITQGSNKEVCEVIEVFRRSGRGFIMPPAGTDLLPETIVDISHESLMRNWERLETWVDEEYESAQMYQRIADAAILYQNNTAGLWRDPELSVALEWKQENNPHQAWALQYNPDFAKSMKFLDASIAGKEKMVAEKKRRRLITNVIAIVFLACACGLTLWALIERGTASKSAKEALTQKSLAEKQEKIAVEKESEAVKNFQTGEVHRKQAVEQTQVAEQQRLEAEKQKRIANIKANETLLQTKIAKREQQKAEGALLDAENEKQIAILQKKIADSLRSEAQSDKKIAEQQRNFSISKTLALKSVSYDRNSEDSVLKALLALQAYKLNRENKNDSFNTEIITALYEANKIIGWDGGSVLYAHTAEVNGLAASPDGKHIASAGNDGKVILWNLNDDKTTHTVLYDGKNPFSAIAFSTDGQWLASSSGSLLYTWKLSAPNQKPNVINGHKDKITSIVITKDYIISGSLDSIIIINKLSDNSNQNVKIESRVLSLAYSPEKNLLAAGCENGAIFTMAMGGNDITPSQLIKSGSQVSGISFNATGAYIAAAYSDGSLKIWYSSVQKPQLADKLTGHKSALSSAAFGRGNQLASAGLDGKVKLWLCFGNYPPLTFGEHDSWVMSMAMSPDGKKIYSGGRDKTVRVYDINQSDLVARLRKKVSRNFSKEEWDYYMGSKTPYEKVIADLP